MKLKIICHINFRPWRHRSPITVCVPTHLQMSPPNIMLLIVIQWHTYLSTVMMCTELLLLKVLAVFFQQTALRLDRVFVLRLKQDAYLGQCRWHYKLFINVGISNETYLHRIWLVYQNKIKFRNQCESNETLCWDCYGDEPLSTVNYYKTIR